MTENKKRRFLGVGVGIGAIAAIGLLAFAILLAFAASGSGGGGVDQNVEGSEGFAVTASTVTTGINYQGMLTDSAGSPLNGTYTMTFRLYSVSSRGTALATDTHSVVVTGGLFNTNIDFAQRYFDGRALWLGIKVGADAEEMTPRQELRPVPYALSLRPGAVISGSDQGGPALEVKNTCSASGSDGVRVSTTGRHSYGVYAKTSGFNSDGVHAETTRRDSYGVYAKTSGFNSDGVHAHTSGNRSEGVYAYTSGYDSPAVYGYGKQDVGVYGKGKEGGYFTTTTAGTTSDQLAGVHVSTAYNYNPGVRIETTSDHSDGVLVSTYGLGSEGVKANAFGDYSEGVDACSVKYHGINACTAREDGNYGFFTISNIYAGWKIDLVGTIDPIIVEGFKTDPAIDYEVGEVVCLDESGYVKPCSKADDTRVVGVVGPTVEIEEGEISVVIMGYRGAKPDEEHVEVMEKRLERAEARVVEVKQSENVEEKENQESEITMLRSQIEEAKSVTRQVVKVKVDASYNPIKIGNLLTTSPTKGRAMKAQPVDIGGVEIYRPGTIIGKAMEPLESGTGLIEVFVTLQ